LSDRPDQIRFDPDVIFLILRPHKLSQVLLILTVLAILPFGIACDSEGDLHPAEPPFESRSDIETLTDPLREEAYPGLESKHRGFQEALESKLEEHRNAEGREGILAEKRLYSIFDEELIIRDFFQDRKGGFYLDVGCANAVETSNTYYLEKHLGWTGIGIDALEDYAAEWRKMRPRSKFLRHLVSDQSGDTERFYKSFGRGISSTDQEWASGKAFGADFPTEEIQAETITLNDLLAREGVDRIDLLSMDIEGHEPKALAGFDIERFQPELVVIERQLHRQKNREVARYFMQHGYERIEKYRAYDSVNDYYRPRRPTQQNPDQK
jgi:FkbM family methyltransferase